VAGCNNADGVLRETPSPGTTRTSPAVSATPTTEQERILAQYRGYWAALSPASEAPVAQRKGILEPYATDPALSTALRGIRAAENLGQVYYGVIATHPEITKLTGGDASVRDCQDASKAGRKERDTGKIVTRGTTHDLALVTLKRGSDGVWRVATVDYPGGAC
jgi:hypothetical protein